MRSKVYGLCFFVLVAFGNVTAQNELYNNGALLYINGQAGTTKIYNATDMPTLYINGSVVNNTGSLENAGGELQITNDFTNGFKVSEGVKIRLLMVH